MVSASSRILTSILLSLLAVLTLSPLTVHGHEQPPQLVGDYEIRYFSDPSDPIAGSQATLFIQVRNVTSGAQLRVYHFLVEMIPPAGPRLIQHPLSNSTVFTFNQPGNWFLLFEIGVTDLATFDTTATFVAEVSQAQTSGLLAAFAATLVAAIPRSYQRWGHIVAVVLWLGMMLHVANTYRLSSGSQAGLSNFAKTFREADVVVAIAIGLLVLTGVLRALTHGLTTVDSLFASDFGLVLFAKILLASCMIVVGVFNRFVLLPRIRSAIVLDGPLTAGSSDPEERKRVLARTVFYLVILEIVLGALAILFGTVFTQIHTINA